MLGGEDAADDASAFAELPAALETAVPVTFFPEELVALLRGAPLSGAADALARADLWAEAALLERLLYKSRAQHRSGRHYARLMEVRRGLRLLRSLALPARVAALRALLPAAPGGGGGAPPRASLPCAAFAEHTARRLLAGARLCAALRPPLARAAADCAALLAASYFMPLALTGLATCARLAALLRAQQASAAAAYNALAPLLPALPAPHAPGGAAAEPLPALLRCDWGEGDAPDVLAAVGALPLARRAPPLAQPGRAPAGAPGDDVGTAVPRPEEAAPAPATASAPASLAAFVPFDDAAPARKRHRAQPPAPGAAAAQAAPALVFVDRGGGDLDAPIADEAHAGGAGLLVSAERPRYALLTQRTVDAAAAEQAARAAQQAGAKRGRDGKDKRGRGGGGRGGGDAALSLLLGGTGMDGW